MIPIRIFDFDGVLTNDKFIIKPTINDVVVTGRSFEESSQVYRHIFDKFGFLPCIFFSPILKDIRENFRQELHSGAHKHNIIRQLIDSGVTITDIYEDDIKQAEYIVSLYKKKDLPIRIVNEFGYIKDFIYER